MHITSRRHTKVFCGSLVFAEAAMCYRHEADTRVGSVDKELYVELINEWAFSAIAATVFAGPSCWL